MRQPAGGFDRLTVQTALVPQGLPEPVQTNELVTTLCKPIISNLRSQNSAKPFNTPVDPKKYPTYLDLVAKPMDLKTVMRNLDQHRYATIDDCQADVDLIWSNCRAFNGEVRPARAAGARAHMPAGKFNRSARLPAARCGRARFRARRARG